MNAEDADRLLLKAIRNHPPTRPVDIEELDADSSDPFTDDEPLACGVEDPETCDSCQ